MQAHVAVRAVCVLLHTYYYCATVVTTQRKEVTLVMHTYMVWYERCSVSLVLVFASVHVFSNFPGEDTTLSHPYHDMAEGVG